MKSRNGFVSNSSSSSFIIYNKSGSDKNIFHLAAELQWLIKKCDPEAVEYDVADFFRGAVVYYEEHIKDGTAIFPAKKRVNVSFSDEDGNIMEMYFRRCIHPDEPVRTDSFEIENIGCDW